MTYFPERLHENGGDYATAYFEELEKARRSIDVEAITTAAVLLREVVDRGATILTCGNGGSAAIANHLVCDCLKGAATGTVLRPRVVSLSSGVELITAIANDIGVEDIFAYPLVALGREGDLLIAISSSGSSPNIIKAIKAARDNGIRVIAMTGFNGGEAARIADVSLHVDAHNYGVVEDIHQSLMHILAQHLRHRALTDFGLLGRIKF